MVPTGEAASADGHDTMTPRRWAIVGGGRLGTALATALADVERVEGPFGRGFRGEGFDVVVLAVPDREIANAAAAIPVDAGRIVGHCSGATGLDVLAPHECFGLHPLMTVPGTAAIAAGAASALFDGVPAALGGSSARALSVAHELAHRLGMEPFLIADRDRAAYHAAASMASNFLVTVEDAAEVLLRSAGLDRRILLPLVRATLENWGNDGRAALTGPVARGDQVTVDRQRRAVAERAPELLNVFDALVERTRVIAADAP